MSQHLNQVAFSVSDIRRSHRWFQDVIGLVSAGGTESFRGWGAEKVQGVPGARSTCWWLMDTQDYFQIELFEFERPESRPLPADWRMCDIGYNLVGFHVPDFDAALERVARFSVYPVSKVVGTPGRRRVCLRDPDGASIELMEDDFRAPNLRLRPRSENLPTTRFVTLSVPNLAESRDYFVTVLEMEEAHGIQLHGPEHEALWGLEGARRESLLLWADDFLVELAQYLDPVGQPVAPDYRISDLGILNIALGYRNYTDLRRVFDRTVNAGFKPNFPFPLSVGSWGVMYVNDPQRFSIELLFVKPWYDRFMGFTPKHFDTSVEHHAIIDAPVEEVWARLADHENIGDWFCYKGKLVQTGKEHRGGVGAKRELTRFGEKVIEEVVAFEPLRRLDYRLRSGAPLRFHYGRIELTPTADGKVWLTYVIRFVPAIPGTKWLMRWLLGGRVRRGVLRLKEICEEGAAK